MFDFFDEKFNQVNSLKYLMTLGARSYEGSAYKEKLLEVFKEIEEYIISQDGEGSGKKSIVGNRENKTFTLEELAKYNGKNGMVPYVAINGLVYDLSNVPTELLEAHKGLPIGADLSADFAKCHDGNVSLLKNIPVVGKLISSRIMKEFTVEELSKYNGQNGMMKYIAIDGKVYDVTGATIFNKKPHSSLPLGTDLTEQLKQCHNGDMSLLKGLPQVGTLVGTRNSRDEIEPIIPEGHSRRFL